MISQINAHSINLMREREGPRPTNTLAHRIDAGLTLTESNKRIDNHKGKNVLLPTKLASIFLLTSLSFLGAREAHAGSYSETPNKPVGTSLESFDPKLGQPVEAIETPTLPPGFVETRVATGLSKPTAMEFAPDGRLFIAERGGKVKVIKDGALLSEPFLQLDTNTQNDGGLLGITVDPNFENNGYVYVQYIPHYDSGFFQARVSRFKVSNANLDIADPDSETILIETDVDISLSNSFGGAIGFGKDGKLYIGTGDYETPFYAQGTKTLLGKLIRINSDGTLPPDNPTSFMTVYGKQTTEGVNRAIYALGFRDPSKMAVDPKTGTIFINDIGGAIMGKWNEINLLEKGANYGSPICKSSCDDYRFTKPIYEYRNIGPDGLPTYTTITGGAFYRGDTFPSKYDGVYLFGDLPGGWIKYLDPKTLQVFDFLNNAKYPSGLRVGPDGALYYLSFFRESGSVYRIQFKGQAPTPMPMPTETETTIPTSTSTIVSTMIPPVETLSLQTQTPPPRNNNTPESLPKTGTGSQIKDKRAGGLNGGGFEIAELLSAGAGAFGISSIIYRHRFSQSRKSSTKR